MNKTVLTFCLVLVIGYRLSVVGCCAETTTADSVTVSELPSLPKDTKLFPNEEMFGQRGRIGGFVVPPCLIGAYIDQKAFYNGEPALGLKKLGYKPDNQSMKIMYRKPDKKGFGGAYIILRADLSSYKTITFLIRGKKGGETFELGMNDVISNKREDAVYIGSINRFLPAGAITTKWQLAKIPLSYFFGPDLSRAYSLILHFNEIGEGTFWIDEVRFDKGDLVSLGMAEDIKKKGYFLLDNFDYCDLNLLGRKTNNYKKLPSVCVFERTENERSGPAGRSLKLSYKKESTGWCGYYSMLNQIDGEYYDLSQYKSVSFMVKGKEGGEKFEIGMADKNWVIIGDSLKAGSVDKYLPASPSRLTAKPWAGGPGGVTKQWKEVVIPLEDFGLLDLTQMGSFVINFNENGEGTIYIDDLKFYLKSLSDK